MTSDTVRKKVGGAIQIDDPSSHFSPVYLAADTPISSDPTSPTEAEIILQQLPVKVLGTGASLYQGKARDRLSLQFKTIVGRDGITVASDDDTVYVGGSSDSTGSVRAVFSGTGLTGTITSVGTISLANTAVTPGSYTLATITVDQQGRLTSAASGSLLWTATAVSTIGAGLSVSNGTLSSTVTSVAGRTGVVSLSHSDLTDWTSATSAFLTTAPVASVSGRTGTVTLTHSDLTDWTSATSGFLTSAPVTTVAGRTGAVTLSSTDVSGVEAISRKNQASGYAGLDSSGKLTTALLPSSVTGGLSYQGVWNASTNTPTLQDGVGTSGQYYQVNVAGSTTLGSNSVWVVGDQASYDGAHWNRIVGNQASVLSVAGRTGAVVLSNTDISGLGPLATVATVGAGLTNLGGVLSATGAVASVAGKTGVVSLVANDVGGLGPLAIATSVGTGLTLSSGVLSGAVVSVAGKTGVVALTTNDVSGLGLLATVTSVGSGLAINSGTLSKTDAVSSVAGRTGVVTVTTSDLSDFTSSVNALLPAVSIGTLTANAVTANGRTLTVPSGTVILAGLFTEANNAAVTITLGTTSGGSDIMQAVAVPAGGTLSVRVTAFATLSFSTNKPLYISSTNWNGASLNAKLWYLM